MGAKVDRAIRDVRRKGFSKSSAIRILKSSGAIHQAGAHLAAGPPAGMGMTLKRKKRRSS